MMKTNIKQLRFLFIFSCCLSSCNSELNANQVFEKNINSVVELKSFANGIGASFGTGVVIDDSGLVITNAHVISYSLEHKDVTFESLEIRFIKDEQYTTAELLKVDYELDLAVLKLPNVDKTYIPTIMSEKPYSFGDKVYAMGNTSNYGIGISEGIISVPEVIVSYNDKNITAIQADISISKGNSGGALLNNCGELIGITTFRTRDSEGNVNYGFTYCIPIRIVKEFLNSYTN